MTWIAFETAFLMAFPKAMKVRAMLRENKQNLIWMRLEVEKLTLKEIYTEEEVWSHIAFADKGLALAKKLKVEGMPMYIQSVQNNLPELIYEKISTTQTD